MQTRLTSTGIRQRKGDRKIVALTAYTAPMAALLDPHVDVLLVGDSLGMVVYGMDTTLGVTLEMMINHGRAVANASSQALVVVDMPFGSYQASPQQAFENCARVMAECGCGAVKLEGGTEMAETIRFLTGRGIPVMGHVGLQPQRVHTYGGYKAQGKNLEDRARITADAAACEAAGAFCLVLESVPEALGREITEKRSIPTIGIGASPACDGQVLVVDDMLGMFEHTPRFVKQYAALRTQIEKAVKNYAAEVRSGAFPAAGHLITSPQPSQPPERKPRKR